MKRLLGNLEESGALFESIWARLKFEDSTIRESMLFIAEKYCSFLSKRLDWRRHHQCSRKAFEYAVSHGIENSYYAARLYRQVAEAHFLQKEYDAAIQCLTQASCIFDTLGKRSAPCAVETHMTFALSLSAVGRKKESLALFAEAREMAYQFFGPDHPATRHAEECWSAAHPHLAEHASDVPEADSENPTNS